MNALFPLRSPFPLVFAICASTVGCGAAPPDTPPGAPSADGGFTTTAPGDDAGVLPGYDAGTLPGIDAALDDAAPIDASPEAAACTPGTADCDHNPSNACETTLASDPKNCGACGHDCTALPNVSGTGVTCDDGACVVPASACTAGYAHCSSNPNDGCEADLASAATCGSCSTQCTGSTPDCSGGTCTDGCTPATLASCGGSCVDTTSSSANCGMCGNACPAPAFATATCAMSTCGFACNGGYHACGSTCADDTSPETCGTSCTPCPAPVDGVGTCTPQGTCGIGCDSGYHSCDGTTCSNNTSTATCGSSCTPCAVPANGSSTCDGTSCGIACNAGYHACGGNACDDDTSTASCGTSCTPCATPANATAKCSSGACGFTCNAGFADCDGNPANGCEVNLTDDGLNCNTCGHSCLEGACTTGVCQPVVLATVASPDFIALDATNVYFNCGVQGGPEIGAVAKTGFPFAWNPAPNAPFAFTLNGTVLEDIDSAGVEGIATSQIGPGSFAETTDDTTIDGSGNLAWIVTSGGRLYWTSQERTVIATTSDYITPEGSPPATVFTAPSGYEILNLVSSADGMLAWNQCSGTHCSIMVGTPSCNFLGTCTLTGLSIRSITDSAVLFVDATYAYVQTLSTITTVVRANGTLVQSVAATSVGSPGLTVDDGNAYWMSGGAIHSVPVAGGTPVTVASDPKMVNFAMDSTAYYWTTLAGTGAVMKLAR